jgi:hypothetical protein
MEIWKDVDLYEQGLKDFGSLSPAQQDWFLVKHFDIHYGMEGGFGEFLSHAEHMAQLRLLREVLRRLGDIVSAVPKRDSARILRARFRDRRSPGRSAGRSQPVRSAASYPVDAALCIVLASTP